MKDALNLKNWISDDNISILTREGETLSFRKIHLIICRTKNLVKDLIPKNLRTEYDKNIYKVERKHNYLQKFLLEGNFIENSILSNLQKSFRSIVGQLITHNLRLVLSIARRNYSNKGVKLMDLVNEGILGLLVTIFRFDYTMNCKFSTYSIHWIRQKMFRCMNDSIRVVKLPMHMVSSIQAVQNIIEIKEKSDKDSRFIRRVHYLPKKRIVLEQNLKNLDSDIPSIQESVVDNSLESDYENFERKGNRKMIERVVSKLDPLAERIIRLKFGLNLRGNYETEEIAILFKEDKTKIKKIEHSALRKLKQLWKNIKNKAI